MMFPQHSFLKHFAILTLFLEERLKSETWTTRPKGLFLLSSNCITYSYNLMLYFPIIIIFLFIIL